MLGLVEALVGSQEVSRLLGLHRARVHQLIKAGEFPEPVATLAMGSIWTLKSIQEWAATVNRPIHLEALSTDVQADGDSDPEGKREP